MLNFSHVKSTYPIVDEVARHIGASNIFRQKRDKFLTCCWLHKEDTPSMMVNADTNTYRCFGCGQVGTVIDVRCHFMGLNPKNGTDVYKAVSAIVGEESKPLGRFAESQAEVRRNPMPSKKFFGRNAQLVDRAHSRLMQSKGDAFTYAKDRGWIEPRNPYPIGLGKSFGPASNAFALDFPKFVLTAQTAESFGILPDWERARGRLLVDLKKRLTPRAEQMWKDAVKSGAARVKSIPRWSAIPQYHDWIPWEFDSRDCGGNVSRTLLVTEGPGDGLRLENELIAKGVEYDFHVVSIDSASSLKTQNFTRVMKDGQVRTFFSGWDRIVFLLDNDPAGMRVQETAHELLQEIKPLGTAQFVPMPKVEGVNDVSDYFDAGHTVFDLFDLIEKSKSHMY